MAKKLRDLGSFDELIAQRRDAVGADGRTVPIEGFGKTWQIAAPNLQSAEWNDRFQDLVDDVADNVISTTDYRAELADLMLGDQASDFIAAAEKEGVDPLTLLNWALVKVSEDETANPTRPNSRSTRPRAKRR